MRFFILHRKRDASGVSGTGVVAQGIEFDDGVCAIRWLTKLSSTAVYDSIDSVKAIHGHDGATDVLFPDIFTQVLQFHGACLAFNDAMKELRTRNAIHPTDEPRLREAWNLARRALGEAELAS